MNLGALNLISSRVSGSSPPVELFVARIVLGTVPPPICPSKLKICIMSLETFVADPALTKYSIVTKFLGSNFLLSTPSPKYIW